MGLQEDSQAIFRNLLADTDVFGEPVIFTLNDGTEKELDCTVLRDQSIDGNWEGGDIEKETAVVHVSAADDATGIADADDIKELQFEDGKIFQVDMPTSGQGAGCHILAVVQVEFKGRHRLERVEK